MRDQLQRAEPLRIPDTRICPAADQELYHIQMPIPRRPLQRRSFQITAHSVNLGAAVEQPAAYAYVGIDGCPVQRGDILGIARVDAGWVVRVKGDEGGQVAPLCKGMDGLQV